MEVLVVLRGGWCVRGGDRFLVEEAGDKWSGCSLSISLRLRRKRRSRQRGAQLENVDFGASFFVWGNASPGSMVDFWEKLVLGKNVENPPVSDFNRFDGTE